MANNTNQQNGGNDTVYWIIAIGLMMTGFAAPVGVIMIVLKLLGGDKKRGRHPYYIQQEGQAPVGARTSQPEPACAAQPARPRAKSRSRSSAGQDLISSLAQKGKRLTRIGAVLSVLFAIGTLSCLGDAAYWLLDGEFRWFLQELLDIIPVLCCLGGGLGCLWAGLRKQKQARQYRNYLAMIGRQPTVSVSALASATGTSTAKVRDALEDMLDDGLFPGGWLDYGGDRLVLSGQGLTEEKPQAAEPPKTDDGQENAILSEIRAVNDAIANQKLSGQIDRIGVITAKILDYQKAHPDKSPQLHSFLSYYLPTTLKILRAYGQLEAQEVSGENITAAMQRIEGMMDKVVEGFEKQLDLLFQGDAMDITTDVEVLERMLAKDGLSDPQGMTLGL